MGGVRETALRVLTACRRDGAWADAVLRVRLEQEHFSAADSALCTRIVYGVSQNQLLLDFYLSAYCTQKLEHLQPPLPDILRAGAYQILFLDRVPDHAAVHESVELAKTFRRERAAGLVNAVLRKLAREKQSLPALPDGLTGLSLRYSHPLWLVERAAGILGLPDTEAFLAANNRIPPVTVQVNPDRGSALVTELEAEGVRAVPHSWVPGCLELFGTGNPAALSPFRKGEFFVQDPAARLVTLAAALEEGQNVLDVCAAPGGKSFSAALAVGPAGSVLACDVNGKKLRHIRDGADRLGLSSVIRTQQADGREFHSQWAGQFDAVLVDAPCSGLGILRKKPDVRFKDPAELVALPELQYSILRNAARYVRPGGVLVYSTCTILPEENQAVTDKFLSESPEFSMEPFALPPRNGNPFPTDGRITFWPHIHETDGFYLCRMRKSIKIDFD